MFFQNLGIFVVNLAPNGRISDVAERFPIDANNEVPACASQDHDKISNYLKSLPTSDWAHPAFSGDLKESLRILRRRYFSPTCLISLI